MQQPVVQSPEIGASRAGGPLARVEASVTTGPLPALRPSPRARATIIAFTVLLDAMLIWLSFCIAYYLRYVLKVVPIERGTLPVPFADWVPFGIIFSAMQLLSVAGTGLYQLRLGRDLIDEGVLILRGTLVGIGLVVILTTFLPVVAYSRLVSVYAWLMLILLLLLGRGLLYSALAHLHGSGWNARRVLVAGTTPISKMVLQNLLTKGNHGYQLVGFVQESSTGATSMPLRGDFGRFKCLGRVADLERIVLERGIDEVIVALPATHHSEIAEICEHCEAAAVHVKLVPDLFEMSLSRVQMDHIAGIPLIDVRRVNRSRFARAVKRGMDIALSGLAILVLSPIMILTALAIKIESRGPILFGQTRIGKDGVPFAFYKFRSMRTDAEAVREALLAQQTAADVKLFKDRKDPRRTRVGRFIRPTSIDELPQLFNVLRGDMSLVGPRPPLPSEVETYEARHMKRLTVVGGITGMWQVSGRSDISEFEETIVMDTYYIDNWSLALDSKILLRTVLAVLARKGAY